MTNRRHQNNVEERLVRDARVWELRALNGWTQGQIAKEVGLSQNSVFHILKKQSAQYREIYWDKVDQEKTMQVYALKKVSQEMWDAWVKSKAPHKTVKQANITDDSKGTKQIEIKDQHGDPRYMDLYLKALKDIRDILGINAATEVHAKIETNENNSAAVAGFLDELASRATAIRANTIN